MVPGKANGDEAHRRCGPRRRDGNGAGRCRPPLEPGVSHELARWRAQRYADVRYELRIAVTAPVEAAGELSSAWPCAANRSTSCSTRARPPAAGSARSKRTAWRSRSRASCASISSSPRASSAPARTSSASASSRRSRPRAPPSRSTATAKTAPSTCTRCSCRLTPARFSVLRSTGPQGPLRPHARRASELGGDIERARRRQHGNRRREARPLFRATEPISPYLFAFRRGRSRSSTIGKTASRRSPRRGSSCGSPGSRARSARPTRCSPCTARRSIPSARLVRFPVPVSEARSRARAGVPLWRDGARRRDVPARGVGAVPVRAGRRATGAAPRAAPLPRDLAPVVRRSGHDAVVRRPVAQGRLRELPGGEGDRGDHGRTSTRGTRFTSSEGVRGVPHRCDAGYDSDLAAPGESLRGEVRLRQHRLQQSARGAPPGGVLPGRRCVPARRTGLRARPRLRRRRLGRPRARARGCLRAQARRLGEGLGDAARNAGRARRLAARAERPGRALHARASARARRRPVVADAHRAVRRDRWSAAHAAGRARGPHDDGGRLAGTRAPRYVFANHGDYAYGRFMLGDASRAAVLADLSASRIRSCAHCSSTRCGTRYATRGSRRLHTSISRSRRRRGSRTS